ncbi:MAG: hypothetical protein WBX22_12265 [Silvibacterium sp.]
MSAFCPIFCSDNRRRDLVLATANLNGIDYVEVMGAAGCGTRLAVTFLKDARGLILTPNNFLLTGDTSIPITGIEAATNDDPSTVIVVLGQTGDFSPYTLTLVASAADGTSRNPDPPPGIDPQLASVNFSFKAGCPSPADCLPDACCPATPLPAPDIHYLARDYDGFRQAMLDRMAVLIPDWTETHAADSGIALVEALAYAADRVSYLQDAVNTEAYIGTARSRISLRRHTRLVDYRISEGANARVWVCLTASHDGVTVPIKTQIYPLVSGLAPAIDPSSFAASLLTASPGPVFESLAELVLHPEQNQMDFYTWGNGQCCLPVGATQATLSCARHTLAAGQVLIFEEVMGPHTGDPADADPTHRWAVRLTAVTTNLHDPVTGALLTSITWSDADALPFPLCISSMTDSLTLSGVSVARGNILAADQGVWTFNESLGTVPGPPQSPVTGSGCNCGIVAGAAVSHARYQPVLANQPLTFAVPFDEAAPASTFLAPNISTAAPQISLTGSDGVTWLPESDLLEQDSTFPGFVAEVESDGSAHLRFGDGTYGAAPNPNLAFTATYRTGNGAAGNVGREALAHVLFTGLGIIGVRNPLEAAGGVDPETADHIQQVAPFSFESQLRCVTADDYGTMAETLPGVREAKGTIRWTGSWYTAFTSIDPAQAPLSSALESSVRSSLNSMRMMGTDLVVEGAVFVGLRIGLDICVAASQFRGDVYAAVLRVLVTGDRCSGTLGLLDPANFEFGETVYASPVVAAAQSVAGVVAVTLTTFERMDSPTPPGTATPIQLTMGRLEIARCDNDPNHADRGLLILSLDGGK